MASKPLDQTQQKKTAVACLTCRQKRQKCDGRTPICGYCDENKVGCAYPEVQKRRGPPPGYLKAIERRAKKLEAFLGYLIQEEPGLLPGDSIKSYLEYTGRDFLTTYGVDNEEKWEPFCQRFQKSLPVLSGAMSSSGSPEALTPPTISTVPFKRARTSSMGHESPSNGNMMRASDPTLDLRKSSFDQELAALEAMPDAFGGQTLMINGDKLVAQRPPSLWPTDTMWNTFGDDTNDVFHPTPHRQVAFGDIRRISDIRQDLVDENEPPESSSTGMKRQAFEVNYTSSFWRSNDSRYPSPELGGGVGPGLMQSMSRVQLPPKDVQVHLLHVYLETVHPEFPLLDESEIWRYMESSSDGGTPSLPRNLIFAVCSYAACFSPNCGGLAASINTFGGDSAGGTLAEIWSEEAWTSLLTVELRRRCSLDAVQTLCLIALRELGKGQDFQSWIMLGLAVRIAQDLELAGCTSASNRRSPAHRLFRRRVWNCVCVLDLLLSMQLGRQPAIRRHDFVDSATIEAESPQNASLAGTSPLTITKATSIFDQSVRLSRIISQLQSKLFSSSRGKGTPADMLELRGELEAWYQGLPSSCRVSLGHKIPVDILKLHMTYHASLVLLYRPFLADHATQAMDAASNFNVFLDTYQQQHSIAKSHPSLVYFVFTVSISFFLLTRQMRTASTSFTVSLSAQAALLKCLEALDGIAQTWPMAKRCHRVLERLIDGEHFEALSARPRKQDILSNPMALLKSLPVGPQGTRISSSGPMMSMPSSIPWNTGPRTGTTRAETAFTPDMASLTALTDSSAMPTFDLFGGTTGWGLEGLTEWDPTIGMSGDATSEDVQAMLASLLG